MDDSRCQDFFRHPTHTNQRRYEALRAVFLDGCAQTDVAQRFGIAYGSLRQWVYEFRDHCRQGNQASPFFRI
jgi:transposase-like protein